MYIIFGVVSTPFVFKSVLYDIGLTFNITYNMNVNMNKLFTYTSPTPVPTNPRKAANPPYQSPTQSLSPQEQAPTPVPA